jgi:hypothetical protein
MHECDSEATQLDRSSSSYFRGEQPPRDRVARALTSNLMKIIFIRMVRPLLSTYLVTEKLGL